MGGLLQEQRKELLYSVLPAAAIGVFASFFRRVPLGGGDLVLLEEGVDAETEAEAALRFRPHIFAERFFPFSRALQPFGEGEILRAEALLQGVDHVLFFVFEELGREIDVGALLYLREEGLFPPPSFGMFFLAFQCVDNRCPQFFEGWNAPLFLDGCVCPFRERMLFLQGV